METTPILKLITHRPAVASRITLAQLAEWFQRDPANYVAVLDGEKYVGQCSRAQITSLLATRYGFPIHGREVVTAHMQSRTLVVAEETPLLELLSLAWKRPGNEFSEDVAVLSVDGAFRGFISVQTLAVTQNQLLEQKVQLIADANAELLETRDAALAAAKVKSEFLATMSHEIRTPINGILGMAHLLLDTELNEEQRDFAETLKSSGETLIGVINDILDFSKIEAGRVHFECIPFDLHQLVDSVASIVAPRAAEKGIEIFTVVTRHTPRWVKGDPGRMRQILLNLAGNGVKFTEAGHVLLKVDCRAEAVDAAEIYFGVEDTGIGISKQNQEKLFQPFTQADSTITRKYGGTGLGLAISLKLVRQMGSELRVVSEVGKGSIFSYTVALPKHIQPQDELAPVRLQLAGRRAIVAHPNPAGCAAIMERLAAIGIEVEAVHSVPPLLSRVYEQKNDPPLVLLDERFSNACEGISHVLLMRTPSRHEDGGSAGGSEHVTKPLRSGELIDKLLKVASLVPARTRRAEPAISIVISKEREVILLAEDNPVNRKVATKQLEKLGFSVEIAVNGVEAVKAIQARTYRIILMDCQMPEMDGYRATEMIRRIQAEQGETPVHIIAMTADAMPGDREKCLAAGMNDYLTKPVNLEQLRSALKDTRKR